jgi:hypothetical protein
MTDAFLDLDARSTVHDADEPAYRHVDAAVELTRTFGLPAAEADRTNDHDDDDEAAYFRRWSSEEQVAARGAAGAAARDRHEQLALLYRFRAAMLDSPLGVPIERLCNAAEVG